MKIERGGVSLVHDGQLNKPSQASAHKNAGQVKIGMLEKMFGSAATVTLKKSVFSKFVIGKLERHRTVLLRLPTPYCAIKY